MNTEHTPGPWTVSKPSGNYIDTPAGHSVAALTYSATLADAHLIAAAPDLLAALQEVLCDLDTLREPYRNEAICERVRAAIDKATGKETNA
jgi:hypothetical protein